MDVGAAAKGLRSYFETHAEGVACVYLFGSLARGTAHGRSDVDPRRAERIRFEVRARNAYFGLKLILDRYREGAPVSTCCSGQDGSSLP